MRPSPGTLFLAVLLLSASAAAAAVMEWLCRVAVDSLPVVGAPPILHG